MLIEKNGFLGPLQKDPKERACHLLNSSVGFACEYN